MALRTTCFCDGKIIGIENIFTVINGMQINIPEKVVALRKKSRSNELFCPCGCGANLTLVAGDRNLREQHFRIKEGSNKIDCTYVSEGPTSAYSKIVLKCWLDEKLHGTQIESRVPICNITGSERRYELTLLVRERGIAVSYCRNRANLSEDKIDVLERNTPGIHIHYIEDKDNRINSDQQSQMIQYPEWMMKVQSKQGYCLYLSVPENQEIESHYIQAKLAVVNYQKDEDGCWQELSVISEMLSEYSFDSDGNLLCKCNPVSKLVDQEIIKYRKKLEARKEQLKEQEQRRIQEEEKKRIQLEARIEAKKREWSAIHEQNEILKEERKNNKNEETERREAEQSLLEKKQREWMQGIEAVIDNDQENPVHDPSGRRWIRCEYCGKVAPEGEFGSYGGEHHANLGKCNECYRQEKKDILPQYMRYSREEKSVRKLPKNADASICPECGGKLKIRNGKYGAFLGCSNFPRCKYTRNA